MKINQWMAGMGICLSVMAGTVVPAYASSMQTGSSVSEWEEQGHDTVYGMVPIHAVDMNEGIWKIEESELHTGMDPENGILQVEEGSMVLSFSVQQEVLTDKLPDWQNGLILYMLEESSGNSGEVCMVDLSSAQESADEVSIQVSLGALNQDYILTDGTETVSLWVDAADLPEEALKIDLPDYSLIEDALSSVISQEEEDQLVYEAFEAMSADLEDGDYAIEVEIEGGSGKATVDSPTYLYVREGKAYARLRWSSSNYDYMIVGGERYENQAEEGQNSVFEIPVKIMDEEFSVIADTLAMGTPHEVTYSVLFYSGTIGDVSQMPQEAAKRVVVVAFIIIIGGGILNQYVKKKRSAGTGGKKKKHG